MKSIILVLLLTMSLSGCWWTVGPLKNSFPDLPAHLMSEPREMKPIDLTGESLKTALTDTTPSGIPLSQVARTISNNYTTANLNKEQLMLLQQWVREQKKLNP